MKNLEIRLIILFVCAGSLVFPASALASIRLPGIFSDNMVLQRNADVAVWGWAAPGKQMEISVPWSQKKYETRVDARGSWKVKIETPAAGGPYDIIISGDGKVLLKNVLIGDVWFCGGQSNMVMPVKGFTNMPVLHANTAILNGDNPQIRLITIKPAPSNTPQEEAKTTGWSGATPSSVADFSAAGWFFGRMLQKHLHIPIGLINCSRSGSIVEEWMDARTLRRFKNVKLFEHKPSVLYNGMLHPVLGFGIKGVIWYQGESNMPEPENYVSLFPAMVAQWREQWGIGNFPFYYVQIAPFDYKHYKAKYAPYNSAFLRDAQRKDLDSIPNSAMAVTLDIGSLHTIHPPKKKKVGERLSLLALYHTYGLKGIGAESPLFDQLKVKDSIAVVHFDHAGMGLTSYYKPLKGFEVAGSDRKFYPAQAVIRGSTVRLYTPEVKHPVAVRYAFKNYVQGDLFNSFGLPASSFRTDNW